MKILSKYFLLIISGLFIMNCSSKETKEEDFKWIVDEFADIRIQRYQIPGFDELTLKQKELVYYLSEAALAGRDIIYDQNYKYNLLVKRTLENIVDSYSGDRNTEDWNNFMVYLKRIWFSSGIHHHYSFIKFDPGFSYEYFEELVDNSNAEGFSLEEVKTIDELKAKLKPIIFDPKVDALKISLDSNSDLLKKSAMNFYEGVTQKEAEEFYKNMADPADKTPISYGLNSKLVKENGNIKEEVYKIGGLYSEAIEKIIYWLEKAITVAENEQQKEILSLLVEYYKTGDLELWDEYNIAWVKDTTSVVDAVNGFIENYGDPLSCKSAYESLISFKDFEATKRIAAISKQAQWFEDNSTIMDEHKKANVKGISAKVITIAALSGDSFPYPPIGINLPNATWIRKNHGSKSVNLGNIVESYNMAAAGTGFLEEFCYSQEEIDRAKKYGNLGNDLHTDMHEVIGHASGQINPGVGTPNETLKNYASAIEETRADLVAIYYLLDPKLIEIGVMPSLEVGKAEYDRNIRNGYMTQLARVKLGEDISQAHMRNRQLISKWAYEMGKEENVVEIKKRDGKTYIVVNDYDKLRKIFGKQLREIQRITSEGDFEAAKNLVETYGVKVDQELHKEVLKRYAKLNIKPYGGFINPKLVPVMNGDKIVDVKVEYPTDFAGQMMRYAKEYSYLPTIN
ncbi:MAG: dihydrofolate reductase [Ignavibacteria bacterium]|jgi:dipeptidyl-peptidase-3